MTFLQLLLNSFHTKRWWSLVLNNVFTFIRWMWLNNVFTFIKWMWLSHCFYEFLNKTIYVVQSIMYETRDEICKLRKTLYELKQFSKIWYDIIHNYLKKLEFKRIESDHEIFIFEIEVILIVYVNDLLLFDLDIEEIRRIQSEISSRFQMTDLRKLSHYLKMKIIISSDRDSIILKQNTYMKKILTQFKMIDFNLDSTLMKTEVTNTLVSIDNMIDLLIVKWYQQIIKLLMWLAVHIRSNIIYSVRVLSRYSHNSFEIHCNLIKRILRYVVEIMNIDLIFRKNELDTNDLTSYNDFDFAELKNKIHSIKSYIFILIEKVISHSLKKQSIIALSSCEVEYMTLSKTEKEII
jgi:hypothetical protein